MLHYKTYLPFQLSSFSTWKNSNIPLMLRRHNHLGNWLCLIHLEVKCFIFYVHKFLWTLLWLIHSLQKETYKASATHCTVSTVSLNYSYNTFTSRCWAKESMCSAWAPCICYFRLIQTASWSFLTVRWKLKIQMCKWLVCKAEGGKNQKVKHKRVIFCPPCASFSLAHF